jgi:hypothetical protein
LPDLAESLRQAVFADLVAAQDAGAAVKESRDTVALKYGIPYEMVAAIEREGLEKQWPPLG